MQSEKSYWRKWYWGVAIILLLQMMVYYFITIYYQ
jgi:hypothetical protein